MRAASTTIVCHHFGKEWINCALSAMMMGSCCGLVLFPMLAHYLFAHFYFQDVMLIFTAVMSIHVICGLTYCQYVEPQDVIFHIKEDYSAEDKEPSCTFPRFGRALWSVITQLSVSFRYNCFCFSSIFMKTSYWQHAKCILPVVTKMLMKCIASCH